MLNLHLFLHFDSVDLQDLHSITIELKKSAQALSKLVQNSEDCVGLMAMGKELPCPRKAQNPWQPLSPAVTRPSSPAGTEPSSPAGTQQALPSNSTTEDDKF